MFKRGVYMCNTGNTNSNRGLYMSNRGVYVRQFETIGAQHGIHMYAQTGRLVFNPGVHMSNPGLHTVQSGPADVQGPQEAQRLPNLLNENPSGQNPFHKETLGLIGPYDSKTLIGLMKLSAPMATWLQGNRQSSPHGLREA